MKKFFVYEYVVDSNGNKRYVKVKVVIFNVCGADGNLICPPIALPGETSRWIKYLFTKLLIWRKEALLAVGEYSQEKNLPEIITSDSLNGVKAAFFEAIRTCFNITKEDKLLRFYDI